MKASSDAASTSPDWAKAISTPTMSCLRSSKPWKKLWKEDIAPYRDLRKELPFVMVAHAAYPDVTKDSIPASISKKWITDILRKKIGYKGLIVCDDLEMGGVQAAASIEDAAVETMRAGSDIFLVCHNEEFVWKCLREGSRHGGKRQEICGDRGAGGEPCPKREEAIQGTEALEPKHPRRRTSTSFVASCGSSAKKFAWIRSPWESRTHDRRRHHEWHIGRRN